MLPYCSPKSPAITISFLHTICLAQGVVFFFFLFFKPHHTDTNPLEAAHLYLKHNRRWDFSPPLAESRYESVTKYIYFFLIIFFCCSQCVSQRKPQQQPSAGSRKGNRSDGEAKQRIIYGKILFLKLFLPQSCPELTSQILFHCDLSRCTDVTPAPGPGWVAASTRDRAALRGDDCNYGLQGISIYNWRTFFFPFLFIFLTQLITCCCPRRLLYLGQAGCFALNLHPFLI